MIVLLCSHIPESPDTADLEDIAGSYPQSLQERARAFRSPRRRLEYLEGRRLLKAGLERLGAACPLEDLQYTPAGKPYFDVGPFFSISHTRGLAACALSDTSDLGLDVEIRRELEIGDFRPWFSASELDAVRAADNPQAELLRRWTVMEDLYKACGDETGESGPAASGGSERIWAAGREWYVYPIRFSGEFSGSLVTTEVAPEVSPEYIPGVYPSA